MPLISIISSSVRKERKSHRVALYFEKYLAENKLASTDMLDLMSYDFPVFTERLRLQENPSAAAIGFAEKIKSSDGVLIISPEYNGGYPASLKNVTDLLYDEWHRKPIAISTVSGGDFGGTQLITSLQFVLWKMHAATVTTIFPVVKVGQAFDEKGNAADKAATDKLAAIFISELLWSIEANKRMQQI